MGKTDTEQRLLSRAGEIASSGRHIGWWHVASELQFKGGGPLARQVLDKEPIRIEPDRQCQSSLNPPAR